MAITKSEFAEASGHIKVNRPWELSDMRRAQSDAARSSRPAERYKYYHEHLPSNAWLVVASGSRTRRSSQIERSDSQVYALYVTLANEWRSDTILESSVERLVMHHAYQRIIGLGPQVVPYILDDLDESPDHWFWALTSIVGEDHGGHQTSIGAAAQAWLAWGKSAGLIDN